jgi:hypothetical protein
MHLLLRCYQGWSAFSITPEFYSSVFSPDFYLWIFGREGDEFQTNICVAFADVPEQMYIVWSAGKQIPRLSSVAYRICSVVLLGYVAVLILMLKGQNSSIRADGMCMIGLKSFAYVFQVEHAVCC